MTTVVIATGSHLFEAVPQLHYALRMLLFWGLPAMVGTVLIFGRKARVIGFLR